MPIWNPTEIWQLHLFFARYDIVLDAGNRTNLYGYYSTNPKIQVMNMEDMSFPANKFDAVTMSATLSYSGDTRAALSEVARVLKPGGRFALTATYDLESIDWPGDRMPGATITKILGNLGLHAYYYSTTEKTNSHGHRQSSHCLVVQREVPGETPLDPLRL